MTILFAFALVQGLAAQSPDQFDVPASAVVEDMSCTTVVTDRGLDQTVDSPERRSSFKGRRQTWRVGNAEFVITKGKRTSADGEAADIETKMKRTIVLNADVSDETLEWTTDVRTVDSVDTTTSTQRDVYRVNGERSDLITRSSNGRSNPVTESNVRTGVPGDRQSVTTTEGAWTVKTSDRGSYRSVSSMVRACTFTIPQA